VNVSTEERIADLERRLASMEVVPRLRRRSRSMMERVVPPEAGRHFRNGARENLMAMRTMVDHWIRRLDESEEAGPAEPERETIEIR
jgi:CHASE3 domain sensor protein